MARLMKQSGVDWLGDIPADWTVVKLGRIYSFSSGETLTAQDFIDNGNYDVYGANGKRGRYNKSNVSGKHILIGRVGALCGNIHLIDDCIWVTEHALISKKVTESIIDEYAAHLLLSMNLRQYASGTAQPVIAAENICRLKIPVPPIDEQERIAAYLDDKCGRIDSVISKTRATIDEYKKLKQAIITRAVTRGIRPNRTLKHSGIDWLGDIPDDWNVKKIKMCISFVNGFAFESSVLEKEGTYPVIRIGDIKNGTVDFMNANFINESTLQLEPFRIKKNDILIAMSGATVGKLAYITDEPPISFINQRVGIIRSSLGKFIYYCLSTDNFMKYILLLSEGTAQPNISTKNINNYYITIPPIDEQREIAAYLDEKTAAIDSLVAKKNQLVAELERLKKSLIFEYVTGKKEVAQ